MFFFLSRSVFPSFWFVFLFLFSQGRGEGRDEASETRRGGGSKEGEEWEGKDGGIWAGKTKAMDTVIPPTFDT